MAIYCPADCADDTLTPNAPSDCDIDVRKRGIDRIGFFPCGTTLPSPFTCEALEVLVTNRVLVFSSPLANVEVGDPTFEELVKADCLPPDRIITQRAITFEDRIRIETTASTSPAFEVNKFYDYDFWADKQSKKFTVRYMFVFCDGSVVVPYDENGNYLEGVLDVFLAFPRQGTGGTSYILEVKSGNLVFKGDPFALTNKPETEADGDVFNIKACEDVI